MAFVYAVKIKDGLFIGNAEASRDIEFLSNNKISHLINCAALEVPNSLQVYGFRYLSYPWRDSDSTIILDAQDRNVSEFVKFIERCLQKAEGCLIFSVNGQSRSVCVCLAYLMRHYQWRLQSAYDFVRTFHPEMDIRASFLRQLKAFDQRVFAKFAKKDAKMDIFQLTEQFGDVPHEEVDEEQIVLRNTFMNALLVDASQVQDKRPASASARSKKLIWAEPVDRDIMQNQPSHPRHAIHQHVRPVTAFPANRVTFRDDSKKNGAEIPSHSSVASSSSNLATNNSTAASSNSLSSSFGSVSSSTTSLSSMQTSNNAISQGWTSGSFVSSGSAVAPVSAAQPSFDGSQSFSRPSSSVPIPTQSYANDTEDSLQGLQPRPPSSMPSPSGRPVQPQKWAAPRTGGLLKPSADTFQPSSLASSANGTASQPMYSSISLSSSYSNSSAASSVASAPPSQLINAGSRPSSAESSTAPGPRLGPSGANPGASSSSSTATPSISLLSRMSTPLSAQSNSSSQMSVQSAPQSFSTSSSAPTSAGPSESSAFFSSSVSSSAGNAQTGVRAPSPSSRLMIRTGTNQPVQQPVQPRVMVGGFRAPSPAPRGQPSPTAFGTTMSFSSSGMPPSSQQSGTSSFSSSASMSQSQAPFPSSASVTSLGASATSSTAASLSNGVSTSTSGPASIFVRRNPTPMQVRPGQQQQPQQPQQPQAQSQQQQNTTAQPVQLQQRPKSASDTVKKRVTSGPVAYSQSIVSSLRSSIGPDDLAFMRRNALDRPASAPRPSTTSGSLVSDLSNLSMLDASNSSDAADRKRKKKKTKTKTDDVVSRLFRPTASFLSKTSVTTTTPQSFSLSGLRSSTVVPVGTTQTVTRL
eukprot:ANDGO_02379.mRNA.1 hypothetical protein (macronuclear)